MRKLYSLSRFVVLLSTGIVWGAVCQAPDGSEGNGITTQDNQNFLVNSDIELPSTTEPETKFFSTQQLGGVDSHFAFSATIPSDWKVEYVPEIQSINFYDPLAEGETSLDQSQIFVRYFVASQFLTLQTVTIHSRTESTIQGRPAVTYEIEKKGSVPDFPSQPAWRNQKHTVVDIRSTDEEPSVFYVFGLRPGLATATSNEFFQSISFDSEQELIYYPMNQFTQHSTKKFFGTYITPTTSPIQPERFSGFHTGVDVETTPDQQSVDVPVYAWTDGIISLKNSADGYGGVLALESSFQGETYTAIYGHIRLSSVVGEVGDEVIAGQHIAVLGTGYSDETDGERKHLHFGLLKGSSTTLLGYVQSESELDQWIDPVTFFQSYDTHEP